MGEVVLSSEEELEMRAESETEKEEEMGETESETEKKKENRKRKKDKKGGRSSGRVRWDRFLKRMNLRVLLVEADDCTRQIIAALLRKCSYRVAAVPDGLKAWELLKGRPHNIDLILTEVDLPSISGFALLTLIMEHEICKNIPVIMMSKEDSVTTVYKCMLRGAADYLVKPIRRNELRNLWQHVWRRQSLNVGANNPQDESVGQQKEETTSENNAASNHSNGQMACRQRNNEQIEKSSCTKPELEVESAPMENMQEFSQPKWGKLFPSDIVLQKDEACINMGKKFLVHESEAGGSVVDTSKDDITTTLGNEACDNNYVIVNSSREAIDLIGAFRNYPNGSSKGIGEFDSLPQLDLSLKRYHPSGSWNEYTVERRTLGHSNASAFTRYTNRPLQSPSTTVAYASNHLKESGTNSEKMLSNIVAGCCSDTPGITQSEQRSIISLATGQSKESEGANSCSQQRVFPVPVPVKGIRINNLFTGFGSVLPPIFCTQSGPSPMPNPSSFTQQDPSFRVNMFYQSNLENSNFEQQHDPHSQNTNNCANQTIHKQEHKLDSLEDRGHISPATDQSASSSFCNGGVSRHNASSSFCNGGVSCHNSIGYGSTCGSNSNVDNIAFVGAASESKNEEGLFTPSGSSHRSIQREVALTKFRLKRKERCYEKKVRYESRKKLAEQRPRVKGQFVRQAHIDPPPAETDGNSFYG
ncbi:two-component response regulator-like APRR5 isoform X3 [Corylus avellana]|uniref:two-component response regulator-like APRR5 isoform X3 n=1 Tax=Corylus avellana TaxID=13451 RepID=UPI00286C61EE|nr:two-component response regulator-like APRR5 isoform X3 [Corylus avellana]